MAAFIFQPWKIFFIRKTTHSCQLRQCNQSRLPNWLILWSNSLLIEFFDPNSSSESKLSRQNWFQQLKKDPKFWNLSIIIINVLKLIENVKINWLSDKNWLFWSFNGLFWSFNWLFWSYNKPFNQKLVEFNQNWTVLIKNRSKLDWNPDRQLKITFEIPIGPQ